MTDTGWCWVPGLNVSIPSKSRLLGPPPSFTIYLVIAIHKFTHTNFKTDEKEKSLAFITLHHLGSSYTRGTLAQFGLILGK